MRPRMAPDCRSERPRACGEYDRIMSMPKFLIVQRNCVGFDLHSALALRMLPSDNAAMRSEELIRMLRRYAKANGLAFSVVRQRGKGSHVFGCVGDSRSFVPSSRKLPAGTRRAMLR